MNIEEIKGKQRNIRTWNTSAYTRTRKFPLVMS